MALIYEWKQSHVRIYVQRVRAVEQCMDCWWDWGACTHASLDPS